jgi:hypothetical protein
MRACLKLPDMQQWQRSTVMGPHYWAQVSCLILFLLGHVSN